MEVVYDSSSTFSRVMVAAKRVGILLQLYLIFRNIVDVRYTIISEVMGRKARIRLKHLTPF